MDEIYTRMRCLELALTYGEPNNVVNIAKNFYEFVSGKESAEGQFSFHLGEMG